MKNRIFRTDINELNVIVDSTVKAILDSVYKPEGIAQDGSIGLNQKGFLTVAFQRNGALVILRGIANSDPAMIDKGIKALEYGFQFQDESGNFKNEGGYTPLEAISADAFFMQAVGHAALAVKESQYSSQFFPRFVALKSQIIKSMTWLARSDSQLELARQDQYTTNRLLFDALAYTLNGISLENNDLQKIGDQFVQLALDSQQKNGVFPEKGGYDSSYQAVSILNLDWYWLWTQNDKLKGDIFDALKKAAQWEKKRIDKKTGEVDTDGNTRTGSCQETGSSGKCKEVSYTEVALSLAYWSVIGDDQQAANLASLVMQYRLTQK